ncbi:MAG: ATP-binding protein [Candidatus Krumholzibacteriia bacterium]
MKTTSLVAHVAIYAIGFAVLAKLFPWPLFILVAVVFTLFHLYMVERGKRLRYSAAVNLSRTARIEGFPTLPRVGSRSMDDLMLVAVKEMTTELEKKCYQLVEKNIQLLSLKEISATIISSLDEARVVDAVQSFLGNGLGFKEVFVGIATGDSNHMRVYTLREAFEGESLRNDHVVRLDALQGLMGKAVATRRSVLIKDAAEHPIGDVAGRPMFEGSTLTSYLIVPMVKSKLSKECGVNGECLLKHPSVDNDDMTGAEKTVCAACGRVPVLGVLGVTDGFKAAAVSKLDLVAVEALAVQMSTLLENTQLYDELKKEEIFRENVINSMMNGLITADTNGAVLLANQAAEKLSGYTSGELGGMDIARLITGRSGGPEDGPVVRTLRNRKKAVQKEAWLTKRDGKKVPIMLNTSLLMDEDRRVQGVLAMFLDITRIKGMEKTIRQLDKLAALGRFSSSMAHEIRNPLAGIVAGIEYLKRAKAIPGDQKDNISFILREVNRIDRLITDILNVVRTGELVYQPVAIDSLIRSSITGIKDLASRDNVKISTKFPADLKPMMLDADRITQVMINLLKNAVEASAPGGEVRVQVSFPGEDSHVLFDDTDNLVIIEVKDDGAGFSEQEKSKIFEPFFTTKHEGTGLGLYVTHSIIERHGGYVFADSEKGKGSVFTVYLPLGKVQHGESTTVSHPAGR